MAQPLAAGFDEAKRADAVPFDLEEMLIRIKGLADLGQHRWDKVGEGGHQMLQRNLGKSASGRGGAPSPDVLVYPNAAMPRRPAVGLAGWTTDSVRVTVV